MKPSFLLIQAQFAEKPDSLMVTLFTVEMKCFIVILLYFEFVLNRLHISAGLESIKKELDK